MKMNVKELREALEKFPDDMEVAVPDYDDEYFVPHIRKEVMFKSLKISGFYLDTVPSCAKADNFEKIEVVLIG